MLCKLAVLLNILNSTLSHLRGLEYHLIELQNASCPESIRSVFLEIRGVKDSQQFLPIYIAYKKLRTDILTLHVAPHVIGFVSLLSVNFDHLSSFLGNRGR